ncbi:MAG TPA: tRNA 2-thiocytidine(32) synthetase TtcA [Chloroflexota bacterium]|nr:tRNA 2-thiocytidine(32) synthetase TtcA [Chloroflexota bacterium]
MNARLEDQQHSANFSKLRRRLERLTAQAVTDYSMLQDGDMVMVCLSGGKDSYTLLDTLSALQARAPISFDLVAMNLDQKQPGFPEHVLPEYLSRFGVAFNIVKQDTYSVVKVKIPAGKTMCSLCSRLRRGVIYRMAGELGATKIALGHHRDDILETFFLNLFFGGRLKAMSPKLVSDDGANVVIRPLAYCHEKDIARYARGRAFPIIPCTLCGSQETLQRKVIRGMLDEWERQDPGRVDSIFRALQNVSPSHLLDKTLFDFQGLSEGVLEGDLVFDTPPVLD